MQMIVDDRCKDFEIQLYRSRMIGGNAPHTFTIRSGMPCCLSTAPCFMQYMLPGFPPSRSSEWASRHLWHVQHVMHSACSSSTGGNADEALAPRDASGFCTLPS